MPIERDNRNVNDAIDEIVLEVNAELEAIQEDIEDASIKIYLAYFAQSSTSAPTVNVFKNTTGKTWTWARNGVGQYNVPFPSGVTTIFMPTSSNYSQGAITQKIIDGSGVETGSFILYVDGTTLRLHIYNTDGDFAEYSTLLGNTIIALPPIYIL
jgi:hypothetical protein